MTAKQSTEPGRRIVREKKTIAAMVKIYCGSQHPHTAGLCESCRQLLDYAECRLDRCPFGEDKNSCQQCPIHCYQQDRRQQIQEVMRFAGPRMLFRHPLLALMHWWDEAVGRRRSVERSEEQRH
jgi:hypothetical protein